MKRELLLALRGGDAAAFAEVVRTFTPRLRRMAMTFFHSPFEQEEAVQEAFLHLFKQREQIDADLDEKFEGFLSTLARRRMIDLLRARHPEAEVIGEERSSADGSPPPGPHELAEARELEVLMARFEERLKPGFQRYFRAVFVNGQDEESARVSLEMGALRARYVKKVLVSKLRRHRPLLERLDGRSRGRSS